MSAYDKYRDELPEDVERLADRIVKLERVLRDLLEDTQHAEHACSWKHCPVRNAKAALADCEVET